MPRVLPLGERFKTDLQLMDGRMVRGIIEMPPSSHKPTHQFLHLQRVLLVDPQAQVAAKDVIVTSFGRKYLCATSLEASYGDFQLYKSFHLIEMTDTLLWQRMVKETDSISGLQRDADTATSLGNIEVSLENIAATADSGFKTSQPRYQVVTGANIQLGDRVGDYIVKTINHILDITVAEVQ